jgi:predicted nucleic acid-binding protein
LSFLCKAVATRKIGIDPSVAAGFVEDWHMAVRVEPASWGDLADAMRAVPAHGLAFWDAMLWATVRRIGARLLLTEDFQDGRTIEGLRIVDPFAAHNEAIIERELPKARQ